jgi:hypothetical protein
MQTLMQTLMQTCYILHSIVRNEYGPLKAIEFKVIGLGIQWRNGLTMRVTARLCLHRFA